MGMLYITHNKHTMNRQVYMNVLTGSLVCRPLAGCPWAKYCNVWLLPCSEGSDLALHAAAGGCLSASACACRPQAEELALAKGTDGVRQGSGINRCT